MRLTSFMRACGTAALALFAAQPALAQIDEADRIARCRNNQAALAQLEATRGSYATDEQIARARTALVAMRRLESQMNANTEDIESLSHLIADRTINNPNSRELVEMKAEVAERAAQNAALGERLRLAGNWVNFNCAREDAGCQLMLPRRLAQGIDAAVAQQPRRRQFLQQVQSYRSNLVVLRCDPAGQSSGFAGGFPAMAGTWRGGNGAGSVYSFSQNGAAVTWTRNDNDEVGTATVTGNSISASYRSSYGTGSAGGTIEFDASRNPVRIRWSNGDTYVRQ